MAKQRRGVEMPRAARAYARAIPDLNVDALNSQSVLRTKRVKNRLEIELNKSHHLFSELKGLIEAIENSERRENGKALNDRAKNALKFMVEGSELLARAKKR